MRCSDGTQFCCTQSRKGAGSSKPRVTAFCATAFFDWLVSQNELKANPAKGVSAPKAPRHLPKNIDVDDMNRLLDIDQRSSLYATVQCWK